MGRQTTRRAFLGAAGLGLLSGCAGLDRFGEESPDPIWSGRLQDIVPDEPEPAVVESAPVSIGRAAFDARRRRVTRLLRTVPLPLSPQEIPNGHVRQHLLDAAEEATVHVERARDASSRLIALQALRTARGRARYAAAGWAYVDDADIAETLAAEWADTREAARSFRSDHEYRGTDPIRAALVHARIERGLRRVIERDRVDAHGGQGSLLTAAEWGEHAERATARLADSRLLYDRFTATLADDAGTVYGPLCDAVAYLSETLRTRSGELPPPPTDAYGDLRSELRYRLRDAAAENPKRVADADGPASALLAATGGLTDVLAFQAIQSRIDDGETFAVETAGELRDRRSTALTALETALEASPRRDLARHVVADAAATVAFADEGINRLEGRVDPSRLSDRVRLYVTAAARARQVPDACRAVVDALAERE